MRQKAVEAATGALRHTGLSGNALRTRKVGRVEGWRGGVRRSMPVAAPFVWRCLSGLSRSSVSTPRSSNWIPSEEPDRRPGWRMQFNLLAAISPQMTPSVAQMPSILFDDRSPLPGQILPFPVRASASSSASLGIGTIEQTRGSPLSQAIKSAQQRLGVDHVGLCPSRPPIHRGLQGNMTCTAIPHRARKRASRIPSRPTSLVSITRAIFQPADTHLAFRSSTKETDLSPPASSTCL
jgi:hypothetical protein